ncbi:hypothetical protein WMY93_032807 [Mugilogobius chulae]|uniref:Uncharacterized protein n=1 Tax=Mugilogobius chulae TaxID=88201 RepID=A0AAW0MQE8_9GOBI
MVLGSQNVTLEPPSFPLQVNAALHVNKRREDSFSTEAFIFIQTDGSSRQSCCSAFWDLEFRLFCASRQRNREEEKREGEERERTEREKRERNREREREKRERNRERGERERREREESDAEIEEK